MRIIKINNRQLWQWHEITNNWSERLLIHFWMHQLEHESSIPTEITTITTNATTFDQSIEQNAICHAIDPGWSFEDPPLCWCQTGVEQQITDQRRSCCILSCNLCVYTERQQAIRNGMLYDCEVLSSSNFIPVNPITPDELQILLTLEKRSSEDNKQPTTCKATEKEQQRKIYFN